MMGEMTSAVPSFHPQLRFCSRKFLMANFQQKSQDRLSLAQTSHVIMPEPTTVTGVARTLLRGVSPKESQDVRRKEMEAQ